MICIELVVYKELKPSFVLSELNNINEYTVLDNRSRL